MSIGIWNSCDDSPVAVIHIQRWHLCDAIDKFNFTSERNVECDILSVARWMPFIYLFIFLRCFSTWKNAHNTFEILQFKLTTSCKANVGTIKMIHLIWNIKFSTKKERVCVRCVYILPWSMTQSLNLSTEKSMQQCVCSHFIATHNEKEISLFVRSNIHGVSFAMGYKKNVSNLKWTSSVCESRSRPLLICINLFSFPTLCCIDEGHTDSYWKKNEYWMDIHIYSSKRWTIYIVIPFGLFDHLSTLHLS